jgi:glycosyltransferase involved in cell wall biosynthesis
MRFLAVVVGRNCAPWATACLDSLAAQEGPHELAVAIVDDASTDGTADLLADYPMPAGWLCRRNVARLGAMRNQWDAWHAVRLGADDVVLWVDLDDRLAHPHVPDAYGRGAWMTYGSYRSEPADSGCSAALRYPADVIVSRTFRGAGFRFNHLRSVSWRVLGLIDEHDCRDDAGNWWTTGCDSAVMLPALELAGGRHAMLDEVLYVYTSDNPASDWRTAKPDVNRNHLQQLARPVKVA